MSAENPTFHVHPNENNRDDDMVSVIVGCPIRFSRKELSEANGEEADFLLAQGRVDLALKSLRSLLGRLYLHLPAARAALDAGPTDLPATVDIGLES